MFRDDKIDFETKKALVLAWAFNYILTTLYRRYLSSQIVIIVDIQRTSTHLNLTQP